MIQLTTENAATASTVINIAHPEWGTMSFQYNEQPLNDGDSCSTVGRGPHSKVLFEYEYQYWAIATIK